MLTHIFVYHFFSASLSTEWNNKNGYFSDDIKKIKNKMKNWKPCEINRKFFLFSLYLIRNQFKTGAILLTLLSIVVVTIESRPHYYSVPFQYQYHHQPNPKPHRAVLENAAQEAHFPDYLRNPFYKTPRWEWQFFAISWIFHFMAFFSLFPPKTEYETH